LDTNILFDTKGIAITPDKINKKIKKFGESYNNTVQKIIEDSETLEESGEVFIKCAARILSNFKMTRNGPFKGVKIGKNGNVIGKKILVNCWEEIGINLMEIRKSVVKSGYPRGRFLLQLNQIEREKLISEIWLISKRLLPFTMGRTSYGLVGASKILFSVLPEIVLPVDNQEWLNLFKTVDIGDVINRMVCDIQKWEKETEKKLNELDSSKKLTTLPSVYNVMAMDARPKS
jgi:hypothetical protein